MRNEFASAAPLRQDQQKPSSHPGQETEVNLEPGGLLCRIYPPMRKEMRA